MKHNLAYTAIALALGMTAGNALAEQTRVTVTIENLAPSQGTSQTPHWVGFHNGQFDIYNGGTPANFLPVQNDPNRSVEALAEDGNNEPISRTFGDFISQGIGSVDGTIAGPNGPIGPGEVASATFVVDSTNPASRYFSYGSMVLPSNDFWYANGNPLAHPIFDDNGNFIAQDFIVTNQDVLDAGTEVNDEVPANTAFFGQQTPDTGVDENGVILDFGDASGLVMFRQPEDGGNILADERFAMGDFAIEGYPLVKISFQAERVPDIQPAVNFRPFLAQGNLSGSAEVPPVDTQATGRVLTSVSPNRVTIVALSRGLRDVQMAHLHLGAEGENGPVIVNLLDGIDVNDRNIQRRLTRAIISRLNDEGLVGPLAGQPLSVLADEIRAGNVYVNIHSTAVPSGELRTQLRVRGR